MDRASNIIMKQFLLLLLFSFFMGNAFAESAGDELLEPEKAFQLQASVKDGNTLIARWKIAEGYYLYRDKFKFEITTPGYTLGSPIIPSGKVKHDEFFGDVEVHRNQIEIVIPIERAAGAADTLQLKTVSQGCADLGVCYPPLTQQANLTLPAAVQTMKRPAPLAALSDLAGNLGGSSGDEFLDPDDAFQVTVDVTDSNTLRASWVIAEGYYLYRDKTGFVLKDAQDIVLGPIQLPPGKTKNDPFFGPVEIYQHVIEAPIPLERATGPAQTITLEAKYQGCAEQGICYPPITKQLSVNLPAHTATTTTIAATKTDAVTKTETASGDAYQSEQDRIAGSLSSGKVWLSLLTFFGLGLLLAFTPCVFPMIPILSGIIIGQGDKITTGRAFTLSLVYVLAMALTYTVVGVLVGLSGENVQALFQNPWVLGIFAVVFVALSFSMFGFYELQMPNAVQSKLSQVSNSQQGGTLMGVAIMGFLSALIVGPCVTAPLIGALIYIANTGDAVLGGLALFALSMGMGAPLLAIGTSAGKLLPKAGPWMDAIKAVFGVLLLAVAIWLVERVLPVQVTMVLWGVLLIVSGIYMGALEGIKQGVSGWYRLWKGVGLIMLLYGALLVVGAAAGGHSVLQPLKGVFGGGVAGTSGQVAHAGLQFQRIKSIDDLQRAVATANQQGKTVMFDFYADWCTSCKEMEAFTFTDPEVQAALGNTVLLQADVTANDAVDKALLKHFGIFGPPAILFFDLKGEELSRYRVVGYVPAEKFAAHVRRANAGE